MKKLQGPAWTRVACRRSLSTTAPLSRKSIFRKKAGRKAPVKDEEYVPTATTQPSPPVPQATKVFTRLEEDVTAAYTRIFLELKSSPVVSHEFRRREFDRRMHRVNAAIEDCFLLVKNRLVLRQYNPLYHRLCQAKNEEFLDNEMRHLMTASLFRDRITPGMEATMKRLTDFTTPYDWFPATRTMQRTVHIHVGPTNSGKTYHALKALEKSKSGVYAGPLRLLAVEVYDRLRANGHACALITGEEVRVPEDTDCYLVSATVEMVPLNRRFDVAVIDEVQMVADFDRGSGWTSALLGVQAKEIHVCGEERTVDLIKKMMATTGDTCIVHKYERLNTLRTSEVALGTRLTQLQKGDAVIAFSRNKLLQLRTKVEKATGRRCAVVYGSLPPEVRKQQAELFNQPDNDYDFVVASDAIGMGINLGIRRIVFMTKAKYDGSGLRDLHPYEVKQIAGRAGRYRTAANPNSGPAEENGGWVTTMQPEDLPFIEEALDADLVPITKASVDAPVSVVERFATFYPPGTQLSFILLQIRAMATVSPLYHLNVSRETLRIANILQDIPLSVADKMTFCYMPASLQTDGALEMMRALAKIVASGQVVDLLDMPELPLQFLNEDASNYYNTNDYLRRLESLSVALNQYLWLSYRYTSLFQSQKTALHVRDLVAQRLVETLTKPSSNQEENERKLEEKRMSGEMDKRIASLRDYHQRKYFFNDGEDEELGMPKTLTEAKAQFEQQIETTAEIVARTGDSVEDVSLEEWMTPLTQAESDAMLEDNLEAIADATARDNRGDDDVSADSDDKLEEYLEAIMDTTAWDDSSDDVSAKVDVLHSETKRPNRKARLGMAMGAAANAWRDGARRRGVAEKRPAVRHGSHNKWDKVFDVRPEEELMAENAFAGMMAASEGFGGREKSRGATGKRRDVVMDDEKFKAAFDDAKGFNPFSNNKQRDVVMDDEKFKAAFDHGKGFNPFKNNKERSVVRDEEGFKAAFDDAKGFNPFRNNKQRDVVMDDEKFKAAFDDGNGFNPFSNNKQRDVVMDDEKFKAAFDDVKGFNPFKNNKERGVVRDEEDFKAAFDDAKGFNPFRNNKAFRDSVRDAADFEAAFRAADSFSGAYRNTKGLKDTGDSKGKRIKAW
ncbi:hypothetical protein CP533_1636 [Ophiocordyceps camponoti-saundersi (nom. inval.)]|nr:hypothetical protein CP533_1636 [Ophiocordyceps camponoti-saundersi (nom. inval.)]